MFDCGFVSSIYTYRVLITFCKTQIACHQKGCFNRIVFIKPNNHKRVGW